MSEVDDDLREWDEWTGKVRFFEAFAKERERAARLETALRQMEGEIAEAVAQERERCARIVEKHYRKCSGGAVVAQHGDEWTRCSAVLAAEIREGKQP